MTTSVTDDIAAGMAARHEGQAAVQAADCAVQRGHGEYIREALATWAGLGVPFHADHVRETAERLSEQDGREFTPADNLLPSIFGGWARAGHIVSTGQRVVSTRPERRGTKNAVYVGYPTSPLLGMSEQDSPAARATPTAPSGARKPADASPTASG